MSHPGEIKLHDVSPRTDSAQALVSPMPIEIFTRSDVEHAAKRAFKHHGTKETVIEFKLHYSENIDRLYNSLLDGTWTKFIKYTSTQKINNNGKVRIINTPNLDTRIYQHCFLIKVEPIYYARDPLVGLNCKKGCGITAKSKKGSLIRNLKHCYYDLNHLKYCLVIDQRQCYPHCTIKVFRKALKAIGVTGILNDFAIKVSFTSDGKLPIGTPTSPMVHHLIMLSFDLKFTEISSFYRRYADNAFFGCETLEEANQIKWRVRNYWWYEYGIRSNRRETIIQPIDKPLDFCGYVFHRNEDRKPTQHNKGYLTMRYDILKRARHANSVNWSSYFGLMIHADLWNELNRIQESMKLSQLTEKVKISRHLDAPTIDIKDLVGVKFIIKDYEIRHDKDGNPNWIKCLVGIPELDILNVPTGRFLAREFHGGYTGILNWITLVEKEFSKDSILPIEDVEIENQSGFIFKDSTNQIKYI